MGQIAISAVAIAAAVAKANPNIANMVPGSFVFVFLYLIRRGWECITKILEVQIILIIDAAEPVITRDIEAGWYDVSPAERLWRAAGAEKAVVHRYGAAPDEHNCHRWRR